MYLHLGRDIVVRIADVIGIFDMDRATVGKITREYLKRAEKNGTVRTITQELPKSFIVCLEEKKEVVYISQISSATLLKRTSFFDMKEM